MANQLANLTLKEGYEQFITDQPSDIPTLVWLLENPDSPLPFPGQIYLRNYDYIHLLLFRGKSPEDEAYVVGFTMESDLRKNWIHLAIFKFFARYLYPQKYKFSANQIKIFEKGFLTARQLKVPALNHFPYHCFENLSMATLRELLVLGSRSPIDRGGSK